VLGLGAALLIARVLGNALYLVPGDHEGLLYGVATTDPVSLCSAACAILALALVASAVPARRATRVDPLTALRTE
jgi:ABC-type lipoprotein release transport system permease subunit